MKFIEFTLHDGDFAFINVAHITMTESNTDGTSIIALSSGEVLHVKESYQAVKDDIKYFTKDT
jgi:uncharacterized protein YlzI (FlbEa/FlbD family)